MSMAGVVAVVVAAGRGLRAGGAMPKQFRQLAGRAMLRPSLAMFAGHPEIDLVQPVIHGDDVALYQAAAAGLDLLHPAIGGTTRQASVLAGLQAIAGRAPTIVLVHEAGHFVASLALRMRPRKFYLGFPPAVVKTTRHGIEYGRFRGELGELAGEPRAGQRVAVRQHDAAGA